MREKPLPRHGSFVSPAPADGNIVERIRSLARTHAHAVAFRWLDNGEQESCTWTFADIDARARAVAAELESRNMRGERALLVYTPGLHFIAAFLGCLYAGVVAVPLNPPRNRRTAETAESIARRSDARLVLTNRSLVDRPVHGGRSFEHERLVTDELDPHRGRGWRPGVLRGSDLAFLQFTSGSTSAPKGVEVTHENLICNSEMIRAGMDHDSTTVFVGWLPLFHDMGLVGNVLQPLYLGVPSVLMAPDAFVQKPVRWLRAIHRYRGTTAGGPNFGYDLCARKIRPSDLVDLDLSSWRVAYNGSEPIRADTLERFAKTFQGTGFRDTAFYPCYGMAEATLFVTGGVARERYRTLRVERASLTRDRIRVARPDEPNAHTFVSSGSPWRDQELAIVERGGSRRVDEGCVGEIWIRGSNVARGYHGCLPSAEDPFGAYLPTGEGPFLRTGDLGFVFDDQLFVTGRIKDVVIQRGQNYYPQDLEQVVGESHHDLVAGAGAAFTADDTGSERLIIVQELKRDSSLPRANSCKPAPQVAALTDSVRQALSHNFGLHASEVVFIRQASLPRTSSGKVQRARCREMWKQGALLNLSPLASSAPQSRALPLHSPRQ